MATFYAQYPANGTSSAIVTTVQGEGTAGTPVGGVLTVQGDPAGTPIPVSGTVTASNPSVGVTGAAVPADATYTGMNVAGNLTGMIGTANGLKVDGSAVNQPVIGTGIAGTAATGVVTIQGIASMTPVKVDPSGGTGSVNVAQFGGNNVVTGTGASGNGIPRVTVSNDSTVGLVAGSAIIGQVGIDQTTPGTTNAIQATSGTVATWQAEGSLPFGSITNSYQSVFTPAAYTKILFMRNNTNASISVSMDAGTTLNYVLDAGDQVTVDLVSNGLKCTTSAIQIKYTSGAPTGGSFRVNGVS